jgi:hypothetical protein
VEVALTTSTAQVGRTNEDFVGGVPDAVVLLDGAGIVGAESICRHGVAWYIRQLGGALLRRLCCADGRPLSGIVADSIDEVSAKHRFTCDVAHPSSPQAAVAMLRVGEERAEYLMLADSYLVFDQDSRRPTVITDQREVTVRRECAKILERSSAGDPDYPRVRETYIEALWARRNQPGGYWVAKDEPHAAFEALTGDVTLAGLRGAALLSNGASRIVEPYGLVGWTEMLNVLSTDGPHELIRRLRAAEAGGLRGSRAVEDKPPDDATVSYCRI